MSNIGTHIFKSKDVKGHIFPVHSDVVVGMHEHFTDGDKFISVSEDRSIAITSSETLEVRKIENMTKSAIMASAMIEQNGDKHLLLGTSAGDLVMVDRDLHVSDILPLKRMKITAICDLENGTIVISHGDDEHGSTVQYISLMENRVINEIKLLPGRKIRDMHKISGIKDKCIVSCSMSNVYWFKVIGSKLELVIDQPSPDDYLHDQVWSDGKGIIKSGQFYFMRDNCPEVIKDIIFEEGAPAEKIYILNKGAVALQVRLSKYQDIIISTIEEKVS